MKLLSILFFSATFAAAVPHHANVRRVVGYVPEDEFRGPVVRAVPTPGPQKPAPMHILPKPQASKPQAPKPQAPKPKVPKPQASKAPTAAPPAATNNSTCPTFPGFSTTLPGAKYSYCCTAAQPCGKPQAAGAKATFYGMGGKPGACGQTFPDSAHYIAMNSAIMGSLSSGTKKNPLCGRKVTVKNAQTGKTATGFVADKCPGCKTSYGIDLSPGLFTQLASKSQGVFSVEWWFE